MKRLIILCMAVVTAFPLWSATGLSDMKWNVLLGYNIGGTAPLSMPAQVRKLNSFTPVANPKVGVGACIPLQGNWGITTGVYFENKGLKAGITAKGYHMALVMDESEIEGDFTGRVDINVKEWMFTVPVMAAYQISPKLTLKAGPYLSLLTARGFDGDAFSGYLRQDNPTGPKVEMADKNGKHGVFEFDENMRKLQCGVGVGADWAVAGRLGLCFDFTWGLSPVFKKDFTTIKETLYPLYGTIGLTYQINK